MLKTSYRHEVRKERYERSHDFQEPRGPDDYYCPGSGPPPAGWESLQDLNERFARYINRARVLEQRNGVFRKQLETLRRMEEACGLEEAFAEQIGLNRQRVRELLADRAKLERELRDAERALDEYNDRYRNECDYQQQMRGNLEQLNKEADGTLLRNLEFQILSQFLQDDINSTKDRHKKNLAEIQTYVNVLHKINQSIPLLPSVSVGISEEQEKLLAQRRVPTMQSQLEENKSALCQLQSQKARLRAETSALEQAIKGTQDSYDDEIQLYNEQIEALRREMEEAERSLEKYTNECRQLAMYQGSLESELERHKRIIENEDNRLNSAIIGTPITLFTSSYHYTPTPSMTSRPKDLTQAIQGITSVKPRQKILAKKGLKKKELSPKDMMDSSGPEEKSGPLHPGEEEARGAGRQEEAAEGEVRREEQPLHFGEAAAPDDVPDGSQISKAFDTLCNMVRDRMRRYRKPEPPADFYTQGRYVLVSGEGSYLDPCFYTSSPSAGHVFVTICCDDDMYGYGDDRPPRPPGPAPAPGPPPVPLTPPPEEDEAKAGRGKGEGKGGGDKGKGKEGGNSGKESQRRGGEGGGGGDPKPMSRDPDPAPGPAPGPAGPAPAGPAPAGPASGHTPRPSQPSGGRSGRDKTPEGSSSASGSRRRGPPPMPSPRSSMPADSMSYEKVEVVESFEKISDDNKVHGYEETAMIVETMIEKTSKKKQGDRS